MFCTKQSIQYKKYCKFPNAGKAATETKVSAASCYSLTEAESNATEMKSFELNEKQTPPNPLPLFDYSGHRFTLALT